MYGIMDDGKDKSEEKSIRKILNYWLKESSHPHLWLEVRNGLRGFQD